MGQISWTYSTTYFRNAGNKAVHMKFVHINSAKSEITEILCKPELSEILCTDNDADINIKREENSDPLALSNYFGTQAHIDGQHLDGDLEPEDCDVQVKIEAHEDFTMDSVDQVDLLDQMDAGDQVNSVEVSLRSGDKYFKVSFFTIEISYTFLLLGENFYLRENLDNPLFGEIGKGNL